MSIYEQISLLVFLGTAFGIYKLLMRLIDKRNSKPLWHPGDEKALSDILSCIYASSNLGDLSTVFAKGVRSHPSYHDLFKVAMEESRQQITKIFPVFSFEEKERKIRKVWIYSFYLTYFINWFNVYLLSLMDSPKENSWIGIITLTGLIGVSMWYTYHCAYKKKGTWLLLMVIMSPLRLILSFAKDEIDWSQWHFTAIYLIPFGFYWFSSLRLRNINCEVKARLQLEGLKKNMCLSENKENAFIAIVESPSANECLI